MVGSCNQLHTVRALSSGQLVSRTAVAGERVRHVSNASAGMGCRLKRSVITTCPGSRYRDEGRPGPPTSRNRRPGPAARRRSRQPVQPPPAVPPAHPRVDMSPPTRFGRGSGAGFMEAPDKGAAHSPARVDVGGDGGRGGDPQALRSGGGPRMTLTSPNVSSASVNIAAKGDVSAPG